MHELPSLQWRRNGHDGVSNHQPHDCLLNRLFKRRSKKHQSSASLAFVRGIHRGPVNTPHKCPATRKVFPFDDVIIWITICGSRVRQFPHENHWQIASRMTEKSLFTATNALFFLKLYFKAWTQSSAKNNHRSLISTLSLRTVFFYLTLWRHHNWSVTSRERGARALWHHIRNCSCTCKLSQRRSSVAYLVRSVYSLLYESLMHFGHWKPNLTSPFHGRFSLTTETEITFAVLFWEYVRQ